jgi:hypothetical protein
MSAHAVIMIPAEGKDAGQFKWSALAVKDQVYKSKAIIVKVSVSLPDEFDDSMQFHRFPIKFKTEKGNTFRIENKRNLGSFVAIGHAGPADGPIFYDKKGNQYQPWSHMAPLVYDENTKTYRAWGQTDSLLVPEPRFPLKRYRYDALQPRARKFWSLVGASLKPKGKIILLGCNYGNKTYMDKVAVASLKATYGPDNSIAAADVKTAVAFVKSAERDQLDNGTRRATPLSAILRINDLSEMKNPYESWDFPMR